MKVLTINSFDKWGGAEQLAFDLVVALGKTVDIKMLVGEKFGQEEWIDTLAPKGVARIASKLTGTETRFSYKALSQHPWYQEADLVHLHNLHSGNSYFELDALQAIANEKPVIWTLHDMWAVTGGEAYTFGHEGYKIGDAQTPYGHIYPLDPNSPDERTAQMELKRDIYSKTAGQITFVPNSQWTEKIVNEAWVNGGNMAVHTIINGVDTDVFKAYQERDRTLPRILVFSSDSPFKGTQVAVEAIRKLEGRYELTCVGQQMGMNERLMPPITDRQELAMLYNQHDILIFPSLAESFGLVVAEAKACGMCVIGSDVGGISEQLSNGRGVLFGAEDVDLLVKELTNAINDLEGVKAIGQKAADDVATNYSATTMQEKYLELYRSLV